MIEIRKIEEVRRGVDIPEITGIYDPLSGKKDGTITPMAPLVVWGRNLRHYALEDFKLCLVAQRKPVEVIEIKLVYTYSDKKVIAAIPELKPGEYRPAVRLKDDEGKVYVLPAGGEGKMEKMRDNKRIYHDRYIVTQSFLIYGIKYYMSL